MCPSSAHPVPARPRHRSYPAANGPDVDRIGVVTATRRTNASRSCSSTPTSGADEIFHPQRAGVLMTACEAGTRNSAAPTTPRMAAIAAVVADRTRAPSPGPVRGQTATRTLAGPSVRPRRLSLVRRRSSGPARARPRLPTIATPTKPTAADQEHNRVDVEARVRLGTPRERRMGTAGERAECTRRWRRAVTPTPAATPTATKSSTRPRAVMPTACSAPVAPVRCCLTNE